MSSSDELTPTVALVTGASSGIGEATALALAARGATVCRRRRPDHAGDLHCVRQDRMALSADEFQGLNVKALGQGCCEAATSAGP